MLFAMYQQTEVQTKVSLLLIKIITISKFSRKLTVVRNEVIYFCPVFKTIILKIKQGCHSLRQKRWFG